MKIIIHHKNQSFATYKHTYLHLNRIALYHTGLNVKQLYALKMLLNFHIVLLISYFFNIIFQVHSATPLAEFISTFSPCIVTVSNLSNSNKLTHITLNFPVILSNKSTKNMWHTHPRRYLHCIAYFIILPENLSHFDECFIPAKLRRIGINHKLSNIPRIFHLCPSLYSIERHFLFLIYGHDQNIISGSNLLQAATFYPDNALSTTFLLQIRNLNDPATVTMVTLLCKVCLDSNLIVVAIPEGERYSAASLTAHHSRMVGGGKDSQIPVMSYSKRHGSSRTYKGDLYQFTPFSKKKNMPPPGFVEVISSMLSGTLNMSRFNSEVTERLDSLGYNVVQVLYLPHSLFYSMEYYATGWSKPQSQIVMADPVMFGFISCDGVRRIGDDRKEDITKIGALLDSFQSNVWITISLVCVTMAGILSLVRHSTRVNSKGELIPQSVMFVVRTLLDNGRPISGKDFNILVRVLCILFALFSLFVTNLYKSALICNETVSNPYFSIFKRFTDLENFSFTTPTFFSREYTNRSSQITYEMTPLQWALTSMVYSKWISEDFNFLYERFIINLTMNGTHLAFHPENKNGFLDFIWNCNKTAFISDVDGLDGYLNYFNKQAGNHAGQGENIPVNIHLFDRE